VIQPSKERKNCLKILDSLVKHGADMHCIVGDDRLCPLHLACGAGNDDMTKWLLEKGAEPDRRSPKNGWTAIIMAAKYGNVRSIAEVMKGGGSINVKDVSA
jgi:ankyrin repeat protein